MNERTVPRQQRPDPRRLSAAIGRRGHRGADVWIPELGLVVLEVRRADRYRVGPSREHSCTRARRLLTPSIGRCVSRPTCADCIRASCTCSTIRSATIAVGCCRSPTSTWCRWNSWRRASPRQPGSYQFSAPGRLPYDHASIIAGAVEHIRSRYAGKPDPDRLLGDEFTLRELRLAHEQIAGRPLQRDWFRRTMEPQLVATGRTTTGTRGRPAELFQRRDAAELQL